MDPLNLLRPEMASTACKQESKSWDFNKLGLTDEIINFYDYITNNEQEHSRRKNTVKSIEKIIKSLWPNAKVMCFGSLRLGLCLPTSDIDLMITNIPLVGNIADLHGILQKRFKSTQQFEKVQGIALTSGYHITKLVDEDTNIKVDLLINSWNGITNTEVIQGYLNDYPLLKYLVIVLKQFLRERNFNDNYTGGISSFSLVLMIVSFLKQHPDPHSVNDKSNLGMLLIEFFEMYGKKFTYSNTGIMMSDQGKHVPKRDLLKHMIGSDRNPFLCIEDPTDKSVNVGRSSRNIRQIKQAFAHAYDDLAVCVLPTCGYLVKPEYSILGRIIHIPYTS